VESPETAYAASPRRPRPVLLLPLFVFLALGGFLLRGLQLDPRNLPSALIDRPLPAFSLPVLGEEREIDRESLVGEVSLLNVWATWCASCRVEHPLLMRLAAAGVPIIGLNYKDVDAAALDWLARLGNPYRLNIVDAEGTLGLDLGVYGAPETYVLDGDGIVRYRHVGVVDAAVWKDALEPVMRQLESGSANLAGACRTSPAPECYRAQVPVYAYSGTGPAPRVAAAGFPGGGG